MFLTKSKPQIRIFFYHFEMIFFSEELSKESKVDEEVAKWGKPLGLPSPIHPVGSSRSLNNDNNRASGTKPSSNTTKKSEKKFTPLYMDLAYVPHHGDANYTDIEFFKRVRARYYVFSGTEPSRAVFDALLEAKKTWENKDLGNNNYIKIESFLKKLTINIEYWMKLFFLNLDFFFEISEVTIIPTYDSDVLGYWVADNEDALTEYKIDLAPSASRCTINLQDHETSCAAYRLEF